MGNSSSQPTVLQQMADGKKPLAAQAVDRADVVGDNCIDGTKESLSPNQGIPRNSFRSLLLARKDNQYSLLSVDADDRCSENISSTAVGISPRVCDSDAENMVQNVTEKVEEAVHQLDVAGCCRSVNTPLATTELENGDCGQSVNTLLTTPAYSPESCRCPSANSNSSSSGDEDATPSSATGHSLKLLLQSPFTAKLGQMKYSPIRSRDD